jgi:hypothetical protein
MTDSAITPFTPSNLEQAEKLALQLSKALILPVSLRGKPADVLAVMITGHELGLSPMQAVRGIHLIDGKVSMSADLAVSLVKRSPLCVSFKLIESNDKLATYETERRGEGKTSLSFTIQQASVAGLAGRGTWQKYPAAMLRARCAMGLARAVYPDLLMGVYDPDEAVEIEARATGEVIRPDPQPAPVDAEWTQVDPGTSDEALKAKLTSYRPTNETMTEKAEMLGVPPPGSNLRAAALKAKVAAAVAETTDETLEAQLLATVKQANAELHEPPEPGSDLDADQDAPPLRSPWESIKYLCAEMNIVDLAEIRKVARSACGEGKTAKTITYDDVKKVADLLSKMRAVAALGQSA